MINLRKSGSIPTFFHIFCKLFCSGFKVKQGFLHGRTKIFRNCLQSVVSCKVCQIIILFCCKTTSLNFLVILNLFFNLLYILFSVSYIILKFCNSCSYKIVFPSQVFFLKGQVLHQIIFLFFCIDYHAINVVLQKLKLINTVFIFLINKSKHLQTLRITLFNNSGDFTELFNLRVKSSCLAIIPHIVKQQGSLYIIVAHFLISFQYGYIITCLIGFPEFLQICFSPFSSSANKLCSQFFIIFYGLSVLNIVSSTPHELKHTTTHKTTNNRIPKVFCKYVISKCFIVS